MLGTLAAVLRSVTRRSSLYPRAVLMTLKIKSDSGSISKGQTTQFGNESNAGYERVTEVKDTDWFWQVKGGHVRIVGRAAIQRNIKVQESNRL